MATQPANPQPVPPARREDRSAFVVAPPDLVQLIGEERLRKLHVAIAQELKGLPRGGEVGIRLEAGGGGVVVDVRLDRTRKL